METEVTFRTSLGLDWNVPGSYFIKVSSTKEDIQEIVLHILSKEASLIFTLNSLPLIGNLQELMDSQGISAESKIELEFFKQTPPLESDGQVNGGDWISCIKLHKDYTFSSNYSGLLQKYNFTQLAVHKELSKSPLKAFDVSEESDHIAMVSKKGEIKVTDLEMNVLGIGSVEHSECLT